MRAEDAANLPDPYCSSAPPATAAAASSPETVEMPYLVPRIDADDNVYDELQEASDTMTDTDTEYYNIGTEA